MSDEADQAAEQQERHLAAALRTREPVVSATGFCAHCNDACNPNRVFCSKDCSEDWHWAQKIKKLSGR